MGFGDLISNYLGVTFISAEEQIKSKSTFGHTGSMVPVFAQGPGAAAFTGAYDNTRIPSKMAALLGLNLDSGPEEYKVPLTKPGE
jgi:alkaline phosphatase